MGKSGCKEGIREWIHDIQDLMSSWGDGSRAQVCLQWDIGEGGHTFMAEQRNGKTYFVDLKREIPT